MNKKEHWLETHGFNEQGFTFCIAGMENTFYIKDYLKAKGCKFDPVLKWHSNRIFDLPQDYVMFPISFDFFFYWDAEQESGYPKPELKPYIKKQIGKLLGSNQSEYMGAPQERLRNLTAAFKQRKGYFGRDNSWVNIYTFEYQHNILVWFTKTALNFTEDELVNLSGTVKKHEEYKGVKTTILTRCRVEKITGNF